MRHRGYLYDRARSWATNKIALPAIHYDDVIETILMSMLYGGRSAYHDAQAAQHQFCTGHGADPPPVLCEGGHTGLEGLQRAAFPAVRLPLYRTDRRDA